MKSLALHLLVIMTLLVCPGRGEKTPEVEGVIPRAVKASGTPSPDGAPEGITTAAREPLKLRGVSESLPVAALQGEPTLEGRNDTGELWTRSPFVG